MRKFNFKIVFVDVKNGNWWEETDSYRGWTYDQAVKKALWRGQVVLRCLDRSNQNITFSVCIVG